MNSNLLPQSTKRWMMFISDVHCLKVSSCNAQAGSCTINTNKLAMRVEFPLKLIGTSCLNLS